MVTGSLGRPNAIYRNAGDGQMVREVSLGAPDGATWAVVVGDLDGDGLPDVAEADAEDVVVIQRNRRRVRSGGSG